MPVSERERLARYRKLQAQLGDEGADTLMEFLPSAGWNEIATRADVQASATLLRGEMAELRADLRGEMAELRAGVRQDLAGTQRTLVLWMAAFAASTWVALLAGVVAG
jgi:hypothetical protein